MRWTGWTTFWSFLIVLGLFLDGRTIYGEVFETNILKLIVFALFAIMSILISKDD